MTIPLLYNAHLRSCDFAARLLAGRGWKESRESLFNVLVTSGDDGGAFSILCPAGTIGFFSSPTANCCERGSCSECQMSSLALAGPTQGGENRGRLCVYGCLMDGEGSHVYRMASTSSELQKLEAERGIRKLQGAWRAVTEGCMAFSYALLAGTRLRLRLLTIQSADWSDMRSGLPTRNSPLRSVQRSSNSKHFILD